MVGHERSGGVVRQYCPFRGQYRHSGAPHASAPCWRYDRRRSRSEVPVSVHLSRMVNRMHVSSWPRAGVLSLAVFAAVTTARPLAAQSGSLQGRVTDSVGIAVVGAVITVDQAALRATASARGVYTLNGVPAGQRVLRVRALGFAPESVQVRVSAGQMTTLDLTLHRPVRQLDAVVVMVGSRARHTAAEELAVPVDVYTAEDIVQQGTTETSQVLANLSPSVNFPKQ